MAFLFSGSLKDILHCHYIDIRYPKNPCGFLGDCFFAFAHRNDEYGYLKRLFCSNISPI